MRKIIIYITIIIVGLVISCKTITTEIEKTPQTVNHRETTELKNDGFINDSTILEETQPDNLEPSQNQKIFETKAKTNNLSFSSNYKEPNTLTVKPDEFVFSTNTTGSDTNIQIHENKKNTLKESSLQVIDSSVTNTVKDSVDVENNSLFVQENTILPIREPVNIVDTPKPPIVPNTKKYEIEVADQKDIQNNNTYLNTFITFINGKYDYFNTALKTIDLKNIIIVLQNKIRTISKEELTLQIKSFLKIMLASIFLLFLIANTIVWIQKKSDKNSMQYQLGNANNENNL